MLTVANPADLLDHRGADLGITGWQGISQAQVNQFADATGDHQWIHVDPARALASPLGTTIAHGYLTLSLIPSMMKELIEVRGAAMKVNYGLNRVRFPTPVPVGSRIRASARIQEVQEVPGGVAAVLEVTIELEGVSKPACVAELISRFYTGGIASGRP